MTSLLLLGCGNMGGALLSGWRGAHEVRTVDPKTPHGASAYASLSDVPESFTPDAVVIAVKPQQLEEALPPCAARFRAAPLYLSIAAGKPLSYYARHLGENARLIRAMPNTPALIGRGVTSLVANAHATPRDRALAESLFGAVGETLWLENESLMHAATALAGSGPAYTFLFLEALTQAGVEAGLPEALARGMALHTVSGGAALAAQSEESLGQLRQNVTSPGGTTEAALRVLMEKDALAGLIGRAVQAAARRSEALGGG